MVLRGHLELGGAMTPSVLSLPVASSDGTSQGLANHVDSLGSVENVPIYVDSPLCGICPG